MMLKMSKKLLLGLLVICVLLQASFVLAANPTAKKPLICKIARGTSPTMKIGDKEINEPGWDQLLTFKSAVEKYSKGRVKVELYPSGSLGSGKALLEQVLNGNIFATLCAESSLGPFYGQIQVLALPYIFKDKTTVSKVINGPVIQKLFNDMAAKSGFRVLSCGANGFVSFANRKRELRVPADMKGLKMRVPEVQIQMEIMKAAGATACPVAWAETYSALQTGVVDGMNGVSAGMVTMCFDEVMKYLTLTRHFAASSILITNEKFFKSLPTNLQKVFIKAGQEAATVLTRSVGKVDDLAVEALKQKGVQVYKPTPDEMRLWVNAIQSPVAAWFKKNVDPKLGGELIKDVNRINKRSK
jgi:tripartite ATP-independent transporter DctP family solute receptor